MFKVFKLKKILKIVFLIYIIFLLYILFLKCEYRVKSSFEFLSKEHIKYCTNLKPLNTVKRYIRGFWISKVNFKNMELYQWMRIES